MLAERCVWHGYCESSATPARWVGVAALTRSQSSGADPNHPAPLGPGVNRGNVDNSGKGHTFYFYAGPGHIDVDMAFEEMDLFGAPLRQTMNFDPLQRQ